MGDGDGDGRHAGLVNLRGALANGFAAMVIHDGDGDGDGDGYHGEVNGDGV